jgi:hypothetical protein
VRRLEIRVRLVERVLQPVPIQSVRLRAELARHRIDQVAKPTGRRDAVFVDVVPQEHHGIHILGREVPLGRVVAVGPGLTGADAQGQVTTSLAGSGRSTGSACLAEVAVRAEAVPVVPPGLQAAYVDVHAVRELWTGSGSAGPHYPAEALVGRHLPVDAHLLVRRAAEWLVGLRRQPGPDDDCIRQWIARGDAERERVVGESTGCTTAEGCPRQVGTERHCRSGAGEGEESAPGQPHRGSEIFGHLIRLLLGCASRGPARTGQRSVVPRRRSGSG